MFGAANPLIGSATGYGSYSRHYTGDAPDSDNDVSYGTDYMGDAPDPASLGSAAPIVGIVVFSVVVLVLAKGLGFRSMIAVNA